MRPVVHHHAHAGGRCPAARGPQRSLALGFHRQPAGRGRRVLVEQVFEYVATLAQPQPETEGLRRSVQVVASQDEAAPRRRQDGLQERLTLVFLRGRRRRPEMGRSPGRVMHDVAVPFGKNRTPDLRGEPEFARLCGQVSRWLREASQ